MPSGRIAWIQREDFILLQKMAKLEERSMTVIVGQAIRERAKATHPTLLEREKTE